jgi:PAS domain-containing protein
MTPEALDHYRTPAPMTELPPEVTGADLPTDLDELRRCVQGLLVHRDWAERYGIAATDIRLHEQQLRSTAELLRRAFELSPEPVAVPRPPVDRVLGICRHFTLLHVAFLRALGVPARVRCGFGHYFDRENWYDHWITERWDGVRWVRDDPQIDDIQAAAIPIDLDPHDQPPGGFMSGAEAWLVARAGDVDPQRFGIFDMWGLSFIGGNLLLDLACLNKVELLPWDVWGLARTFGPYDALDDQLLDTLDDLARLVVSDDVAAIRHRFDSDHQLRVPDQLESFVDGEVVPVWLPTA